ncbi:hypothetical protein N9I63_01440 [Hyphomicrobiales bacterium]|nr:hypothetical protein [Hyphomicrobiales bacterium]
MNIFLIVVGITICLLLLIITLGIDNKSNSANNEDICARLNTLINITRRIDERQHSIDEFRDKTRLSPILEDIHNVLISINNKR